MCLRFMSSGTRSAMVIARRHAVRRGLGAPTANPVGGPAPAGSPRSIPPFKVASAGGMRVGYAQNFAT